MKTSCGILLAIGLLLAGGCRKEEMSTQPRQRPYEPSAFFQNDSSARPLPQGAIPRGQDPLNGSEAVDRAALDAADFPPDFPSAGPELARRLERGRQRYNIDCAVCHGETGAGDGMVVQRGFIQPPAFYPIAAHQAQKPDLYRRERNLLTAPPGYIVEKITNGSGAMYSYADRVEPADRWNIAAYIRALQISRGGVRPADLPPQDRLQAEEGSNRP